MHDWLAIIVVGLVIWLELRGVKRRMDLAVQQLKRLDDRALPTEDQVTLLETGVLRGLASIENAIAEVEREVYATRTDASGIAEKLPTHSQISMFEENVTRDLDSIKNEIVQVGREVYQLAPLKE